MAKEFLAIFIPIVFHSLHDEAVTEFIQPLAGFDWIQADKNLIFFLLLNTIISSYFSNFHYYFYFMNFFQICQRFSLFLSFGQFDFTRVYSFRRTVFVQTWKRKRKLKLIFLVFVVGLTLSRFEHGEKNTLVIYLIFILENILTFLRLFYFF